MATKTCFLICPLGEEGSDIRKTADDLMDLIIVPALDKLDFDVVRADKIPRPSIITTDIIQLVQNAALCIIDLTGSNPNVFYECGRRHETGKPFIQLIRKGEQLPFDVSGIRTIPYDLSTVRSAHEAIKEIQNYTSELSMSDFSTATSGESLSSLARAVQRIERKLDSVTIGINNNSSKETESIEFLERLRIEANPWRAFNDAFDAHELDKARLILPELHKQLGNTGNVLISAAIFANSGDTAAKELCLKILESPSETITGTTIQSAIQALGSYYDIVDGEKDGAKVLGPIIQTQIKRNDIENSDKALIMNELQKLFFVSGEYGYALRVIEQVINLDPSETSYLFYKALILSKLEMHGKAADVIANLLSRMELKNQDFTILSTAALIYASAGRINDLKPIIARMMGIDRQRAEMFIDENEELKFLRTI